MSTKTKVVPLKFVVQPTAYQVACFYKDPEKIIIMSIVTMVEHNNSANTLITKKKNKMKNLDFF